LIFDDWTDFSFHLGLFPIWPHLLLIAHLFGTFRCREAFQKDGDFKGKSAIFTNWSRAEPPMMNDVFFGYRLPSQWLGLAAC
jgi:hypothetical protein